MWPFDILRQRKYERRKKAAMIVMLGAYVEDGLDSEQRARIESEMNRCFSRSDTPAVGWRRWASWDVLAAYRAAAMERCGIPPPIPNLSWADLFRPWRQLPTWLQWPMVGFDFRPASIHYFPMDPATRDAKAYLRESGLSIPAADPPDPSALGSLAKSIRSGLTKQSAEPPSRQPSAV
jgi:hypothetical protein